MSFDYPGDEHVVLSDYERRQFELIERQLASEDPRRPREPRSDTDDYRVNPQWIALMIACGWLALLGLVAAGALLFLLGSAGAVAAFVMHRRSRRPPETED